MDASNPMAFAFFTCFIKYFLREAFPPNPIICVIEGFKKVTRNMILKNENQVQWTR